MDHSQTLPSLAYGDPPSSKRQNGINGHTNERQSVDILLGVILGVALFFIFGMITTVYCTRRSRKQAEDPHGQVSLNRLKKLEAVAPTRCLGEWWATAKQSLGVSEVVENHFVCVVCFEQVGRTQQIHELKCLHVFHKECLEKWYLRSHYTCPLCQTVFFQEKEKNRIMADFVLVA